MARKSQKGRSLTELSASVPSDVPSDAVKDPQTHDLSEKAGRVNWRKKANEVFGPSKSPEIDELIGRVHKSLEREAARKRNTSRDLEEFVEAFREFVPPVIDYCSRGKAARIPVGDPDPAYFLEGQRRFTALWYVATKVPPLSDWPDSDRTLWMLLHTLKSKVRKLWLAIHRIDPEIRDPSIKLRLEQGYRVEDVEIFEASDPIEPSLALESVIVLGESISDSFRELSEDQPHQAADQTQRNADPQRPIINETEYVVLLALYRLKQPLGRRFIRNEANELGASIDEQATSRILTCTLKKLGLAELKAKKAWVISRNGQRHVETDIRGTSFRIHS